MTPAGSPRETARESVKVWDAKTQKELASRKLRPSAILGLAFSAGGGKITAAVREGVYIFDWRDSKTEAVFRKLASPSGLAIDSDGHQLAVSVANSVWTWDPATKSNTRVLDGHEGNVRSLVYSHDGKELATGGADRTVQVWDAETGRLEGSYQGHSKDVTCIRFSPDGQSVAASSRDGTLRIWKIRDGLSEKTLDFGRFKLAGPSLAPTVESLSFSDDGKRVYYLFGKKSTITYLMLIDPNAFWSVARYADVVGFAPGLDRIAQLIAGRIVIKDMAGKPLGECNIDPSFLTFASRPIRTTSELLILGDSHYLVLPPWRPDWGVWDNVKGDWLWRISDNSFPPLSRSTILPRSGNLIGVQPWNRIAILDIRTGETLRQFSGDSFKAHRDGDLLAVVAKGAVEIWSLQKNTRIATFEGEQCSFDESGKLVATRTKDTATIWELPQRKVSEFRSGSTVAFSPDGRRAVASLGDAVMILDPVRPEQGYYSIFAVRATTSRSVPTDGSSLRRLERR